MRTRARQTIFKNSTSQSCANPDTTLFKLPVQRTEEWRKSLNARRLSWSLWFSFALVMTLFSNLQPMLASSSATTTTLALTSGAGAVTTVNAGSVVTLTASVVVTSGGATVKTGQVNFCDSGYSYCTDIHLLGTAQLTSAGKAVLKLVPGVGSHNYQAVFLGTTSALSSASDYTSLAVTGKYKTTTLIAQSGTVDNYTLNAVVAGQGISSPTGQVSFLDSTRNNAVLGSGTLVANPADYAFLDIQSPATGSHSDSVAAGDFNGDGIPDLAVANRADNTVSILLGNSDGTFRKAAVSPATGNTPVAVVTGDFNGDGKADLAVANNVASTVSILLGNGDGTFTLKASPATGSNPSALVVGDFNRDGKADLAVANNSSNSVTMLLGVGDGTFSATASTTPTGHSPTAIAAGDFDGDDKTDLVVANGNDNSLTVLLGKGNGSFTVVSGTVATGRSPQSIVVGDFNQDGSADIAVANSVDNNLSVYMNKGDGSGGFLAPVTYTTGNSPISVMAGDFDGDGNADLAVANSGDSTLTVFLGDGQGNFNPTAVNPVTGSYPLSIAVGDLNGDGYSDIASANFLDGTATVLLAEQQTATASAGPIAVAGSGPHMAVASYPGDHDYSASVSSSTPLYASTPVPVISPASGVYATVQSVSITDSLSGAAIYYTTDGNTPSQSSTLYRGPFQALNSEIVEAIAVGSGYAPSAVATAVYTLTLPAANAPVIKLASGTYPSAQQVTITDSTPGSIIYFTTNGSIPSTSSTVYAGPVLVSSTETLVASAIAPGYSLSASVSAQYIIESSSASFIYSIAGNGNAGYQGDGGLATLAGLNSPSASVFDRAGNLYIADTYNNLVRKVAAGTGVITTVAGTGTAGFSGNGTLAVNAELNWPVALAVDSAGNLFIADSNNFAVRRVDARNGIITTVAGNGTMGNSGDGGSAANAQLSFVDGIAFDGADNLYIADSGNSQIWEVLSATSAITVVAGNGTPGYSGDSGPASGALLNSPNGVAVDRAGNVFIADKNNDAIREITAGTNVISTVVGDSTGVGGYGGDGGVATSAQLNSPLAVTVDAAGDLFIADSLNSVIRRVDANTWTISTVAGNGSFCSPLSGDGSSALSAGLCYPTGITVDAAGNLYVADSLDQRIRMVAVTGAPPAAAAAAPAYNVTGGTYVAGQTVTLSDATPGASIYITMDGTTPTSLSAGYLGPINVSGSVTVKAIAIAPGYLPSPPAIAAYTINYPPAAVISTVAGDGVNGFSGAGGAAARAEFGYLQGLALDGAGNLYMADIGNNVVWMFSPSTGNINIAAGNGTAGYSGDSAAATGAQLNYPSGPAVDQSGNLYIADSNNNVIRLVTAGSKVISTFAGTGVGSYSGDGISAISAELSNPTGVAVDSTGNVYIADSGNSRVRMVSQSTGLISTFAGDGLYVDDGDGGPAAGAGVQQPEALAFDNSGNLFIAEESGRIRRVDANTKVITTVAGNGDQGYSGDGALATNAEISEPMVAFDQASNMYISSLPAAVREVSAATGMITTVVGSGITGFSGDGGSATVAELDQPTGVVVDAAGNLYVADANNFRIRKVTFPAPAATPVFSLAAGSYINTRQVTITDNTQGAKIYYTTDGSTPTEGSALYSGQIAVTVSETLKAMAVANGYAASAVASAAYTIIPPSTPVITWQAPSPITYGTALDSTQLDATTTVPGTWVYTPSAGALLTAGSQTLSVTFTPNDLVDYTTATATTTLTVNQATPAINWTAPAAITYGTTLSAAQLNATASVPGTYVYNPAQGSKPAAGQQTLSVTFTPNDATNYSSATATVSLTVNQATPAITWATPAAITYGTALGSAQLNASSTVQGTYVYNPIAGATLGVGSQTLSVTFTPNDQTDYTTATATVTLTVNKATPTITWATPGAITYGTALSGAQLDATANVAGSFVYTPAAGATPSGGQQTLSVIFTPTDSTDYTTATASVTLTVNKATPTITWVAPDPITYGTTLSATQLDATASVPGNFVYNPAAGATPRAGQQSLSVTFTPTDATDYTTATATVPLTVNKATPTVNWTAPAAITYGTPLSGTQLNATSTVAGTYAYTPIAGTVLAAGTQTLSTTLTPTDSADYNPATATVSVTVNPATPSVAVMPSSPSITTTQTLQVTVNVSGAAGTVAPTGMVILSSGSYSAQQGLSGGTTTFTVAAGALALGSDPLTASYVPDAGSIGTYNTAAQSIIESVLLQIGTAVAKVTATPSGTNITDTEADTVAVSVAGASGQPTPTGMVTLTSGAYSAQQALVSGTASFTIPAGTLAGGANTLTATYSGDATFAIATGTTTVTVSPFVIEVPAISGINPGGNGTANITITSGSSYSGTVDLSCALTGSPAGAASLPTCSVKPPTVTLTTGGSGSSVLTVATTAATTALAQPAGSGLWGLGSGVALAAMLMFGIPSRRRRWLSMVVLLFVVAAAGTIGCGGKASSGGGGGTGTAATTAGTYTFTVTGTDSVTGSVKTSTTVSVTVQ